MKENGIKIICLEQGLITILMGQCTEENGRIMSSLDMGSMNFQMELSTKGSGNIT